MCCEQPPDADVLGPRGESEDDLFRSRVFNPAAYTVPRVVGPRWEGTLGRLNMSGGAMHRARPHEVLQSSANLPLVAGSLGEAAMRLQLSMLSSAAAARVDRVAPHRHQSGFRRLVSGGNVLTSL